MDKRNFGKEVRQTLPGVEKEPNRSGGGLISIYAGIAIREDSDVAQERSCNRMM
jgi:hypothetical protein